MLAIDLVGELRAAGCFDFPPAPDRRPEKCDDHKPHAHRHKTALTKESRLQGLPGKGVDVRNFGSALPNCRGYAPPLARRKCQNIHEVRCALGCLAVRPHLVAACRCPKGMGIYTSLNWRVVAL